MSLRSVVYFENETARYQPFVDVYEADDNLVFEIELPGINPEDVLIKVLDDFVIIEGVKRERREGMRTNYLCMERKFSSFRRMLKIPTPVNTVAGKASYSEGVVILRFPKIRNKVIKIRIEPNQGGFLGR
ncbi:MAG TPA: Hsp20/alpha crystallin family protein [Thermodesulfovibrionales bacterium]|jgi:HSP20 family protein|nr:Hsp20/alpha crystallin family protein [Thermodesulfovibrionales bacterium]